MRIIFSIEVASSVALAVFSACGGSKRIDVLINSAGIAGVPGQKTGNVNYESWAHVFDVNTMGPLRVLETFSDHIAGSEHRLVVTITSGMGSLAEYTSGGSIF